MDEIDLAENGGNWRALVNVVMKFGVHNMLEIYWLAEELIGSQR
jgi:hypothetical protein